MINSINNVGSSVSPQKKTNLIDLFVYGTLRTKGAIGSAMYTSEYVGDNITKPKYTMYDLGAFPCIAEKGDTAIHVEHYRVTKTQLLHIDAIESHPRMYKRKKITLADGTRGWIYIWNRSDVTLTERRVISSGDWLNRHTEETQNDI